MTLTLEEAEKRLEAQAVEIGKLQNTVDSMPIGKTTELEKQIAEMTKRFDQLHENYAKLTVKEETNGAHHCFWCQ